jgi:elongation factor P
MITTSDFKTGVTIEYQGSIYQIMDFQHVKPGKGQAYVTTKLKNLRTGSTTIYNFQAGEKMPTAMIEKKKMQYIYKDSDLLTFMDQETFDQIEIPESRLEWETNFLMEGMEVIVIDYHGEVLGVSLKEKVELKVVDAPPAVSGNTAQNALKEVILETGFKVFAPMFINSGDVIIVNTLTGKYDSRA